MFWKSRYMSVLLSLFQAHPEFKLTYQGVYLTWLWSVLDYLQPEKLGFPYELGRVIGKTLFLQGEPGNSKWEKVTTFERYAFLRYLHCLFDIIDDSRFFIVRYTFMPSFRLRVQKQCLAEVICAHVERYGIVSRITKIKLADTLWNTANWVSNTTWAHLLDWVDTTSAQAFKKRRVLPKGSQITLDYND